jgi:hypothetical protein
MRQLTAVTIAFGLALSTTASAETRLNLLSNDLISVCVYAFQVYSPGSMFCVSKGRALKCVAGGQNPPRAASWELVADKHDFTSLNCDEAVLDAPEKPQTK